MEETTIRKRRTDTKGSHSTVNSAFGRMGNRFSTSSIFYLLSGLVVICVIFAVLKPRAFLSEYNIRTLLTDSAVLLILAIGQMFVVTTAGIDLSVGSVLVFSGVVANMTMVALGGKGPGTILLGFLVSVAAGFLWGVLNGTLVARLKIPSLIVTLGTSGMAMGFALILSNGSDLGGVPTELPTVLGIGRFLGVIPWLVLIAIVIVAIGAVWMRMTRFGMYTIAIGTNPEAGRRAGINVDRQLISIYCIAGFLAGLAGYLNLARFASTTIAGHGSDNLQSIAAVVLGGTSLMGGIASVTGTVIGVFIPVILQNGLVMLSVKPFWQQAIIGMIIILAVYTDQLKRKGTVSTRNNDK